MERKRKKTISCAAFASQLNFEYIVVNTFVLFFRRFYLIAVNIYECRRFSEYEIEIKDHI